MTEANDHQTIRVAIPGWANTASTRLVLQALRNAGGEGRFVGGCVRDHLMGRPIGDIDIATTLHPDSTMSALRRVGVKVAPTGLAHGTITAVLDDTTLEITTLRQDVETDGRHARVAFTDQWQEDAARRDFTMNALYMDVDGELFDYFNGLPDLHRKRLRFIGDAAARIEEDHLRILRFFRFSAQMAILPPDGEGLAACAESAAKLQNLSRERIWQEMQKLLAAPAVRPVLKLMQATGVADQLMPGGGPGFHDADILSSLPEGADEIRVLRRLLPDLDQARQLCQDWKISRRDAARLYRLYDFRLPEVAYVTTPGLRQLIYRAGRDAFQDMIWLAEAERRPDLDRLQETLVTWENPRFPLGGQDVMALGVAAGPEVGRFLRQAEEQWIAGDFRADRATCLRELENLIERGLPQSRA